VKSAQDLPNVVVFGRPGAGKTTVAIAAVEKFKALDDAQDVFCLGLDLDVCVPQWMKDNFANGMYPTLEQRQEFAKGCCEYVEKELDEKWQNGSVNVATIVSFSFVNTDLRDIYRSRFPDSSWVLIDTTEDESTRRINAREDHFYKGDTSSDETSDSDLKSVEDEEDSEPDVDNSEWNFAPVTFPHVSLDGNQPIDVNAEKVLDVLLAKTDIRQ
jgi:gluconate kinase